MPSLWSKFFPRSRMNWDWSEDGDGRVAMLWHLRTELSTCQQAVYTKWFKNRATLFSDELFIAMLSLVSAKEVDSLGLSQDALILLGTLHEDSPLGTRELKSLSGFEGRENSSRFESALRQLWRKLLIVGYGEVEEGGFPSLAVGSSRLLFEDLWDESKSVSAEQRLKTVEKYFDSKSEFFRQYVRLENELIGNA